MVYREDQDYTDPISFIQPAVIIPAGNATIAIPMKEETMVIILPNVVTGQMSPYPTVVREIVAQQIASKKVWKLSGSTLKITKAQTIIQPIAR